jgi:hypothetical protein
LAHIGIQLANGSPSATVTEEVTAIQAAIWELEYGLTAHSSDSAINNYISSFYSNALAAGPGGSSAEEIYNSAHQSFVDGSPSLTTPVPEPSTWAMMMLGFCGVGCMAYRQVKASVAGRLNYDQQV